LEAGGEVCWAGRGKMGLGGLGWDGVDEEVGGLWVVEGMGACRWGSGGGGRGCRRGGVGLEVEGGGGGTERVISEKGILSWGDLREGEMMGRADTRDGDIYLVKGLIGNL